MAFCKIFAKYWGKLQPSSPTYMLIFTICFIQLNNVYNENNKWSKVLAPYVTSSAARWHTSSFSISAMFWLSLFWPQLKRWRILKFSLTSNNLTIEEACLVILRMLLDTAGVWPKFFYIGGTWYMIMILISNDMYLWFCTFYVLPRAPYVHIHCGFIPTVPWTLSNNISSTFRCIKFSFK